MVQVSSSGTGRDKSLDRVKRTCGDIGHDAWGTSGSSGAATGLSAGLVGVWARTGAPVSVGSGSKLFW